MCLTVFGDESKEGSILVQQLYKGYFSVFIFIIRGILGKASQHFSFQPVPMESIVYLVLLLYDISAQ